MREIRKELRKMAQENDWLPDKTLALIVYNNHLNGDWKRQNYYRPSRESLARMARYEWVHDPNNYRGMISSSQYRVNLTGAFESCPVPTLITEGRWDLTWNTDKPEILHKNHPGSELVFFEKAGHGIYEEEPDKFFKVLKNFIKKLPDVSSSDVNAYKEYLIEWDRKMKESFVYKIRTFGWGRSGSEKLANDYSREWLAQFTTSWHFLRTGFALYDLKNYEEALFVFERMRASMKEREERENEALALIWQGHMLDLLGKRKEAIACYTQVADMNIDESWQHSQYRLTYQVSPYARERMKTPFKRIENKDLD
jgi:tetratricopeptide (TPR) repeat protein